MYLRILAISLLTLSIAFPVQARTIQDPNDKSLPYDVGGKEYYVQCKPGEYAVVADIIAPEGRYATIPNPECSNKEQLQSAVQAIQNAFKNYKSGNFTGAINDCLAIKDVYKSLETIVGPGPAAELDRLFGGSRGRNAAVCTILSVYVQPGATITGVALMAQHKPGDVWSKCEFGDDSKCGKAWMSFPGHYILEGDKESGQSLSVTFKNWRHNWRRAARLVVFFKLPENASIIEIR